MIFIDKLIGPCRQGSIILENGSKIINTKSKGQCKISEHAAVCNSQLDKYFAIGNFSFMQRTICRRYITIGSRVSIGAFSHPTNWLSTLEFQFRDSTPFYSETLPTTNHKDISQYISEVNIGPDTWIGDNCFVKTGITLGAGCIIAAGSVVVKNVEPYAIVGGNPAKTIKYRFDKKTIDKLLEVKWWELDIKELEGVEFNDIDLAIEKIREIKGA